MSATGRRPKRIELDFYETPAWLVEAILPHVVTPETRSVIDPCCGTGAILDVLRASTGCELYGIEVEPGRWHEAQAKGHRVMCENALFVPWFGADVCLMNPPYMLAERFVEESLKRTSVTAALLRLNFLASQHRATFLRANPCEVYVSPRRPSFRDGKTDATDYAWFVWRRGETSSRVHILPTERLSR